MRYNVKIVQEGKWVDYCKATTIQQATLIVKDLSSSGITAGFQLPSQVLERTTDALSRSEKLRR